MAYNILNDDGTKELYDVYYNQECNKSTRILSIYAEDSDKAIAIANNVLSLLNVDYEIVDCQ